MDMVYKDRVALVVGGSSGTGKALASQLVAAGCSVGIIARDEVKLASARDEILKHALDGKTFVEAMSCDVTDDRRARDVISSFVDAHGVPDFLFNCAGAAYPRYIQDYTIHDFESAMRLDYLGTVIPVMALLPGMMARGSGFIVNISSAMGFVGMIGYGTYAPAKFAVAGFSEVLRHEMKPHGIKVSVVFPSDIDTPGFKTENETKPEECRIISEHGKLMQPEDVAARILKEVAKGRFYILPGESSFIFKMKRLFPGLVYSIIDNDLIKARRKLGKVKHDARHQRT